MPLPVVVVAQARPEFEIRPINGRGISSRCMAVFVIRISNI
jgi:hypothetical protein